jgi:hypothetical protein
MSEERGDLRQPSHEPHAALAIAQSRLVPKRVSLSWRHGRGPGHVPLLARREAREDSCAQWQDLTAKGTSVVAHPTQME